jgi:two-component system, OmpR family, KDP operon response regulator KdpE
MCLGRACCTGTAVSPPTMQILVVEDDVHLTHTVRHLLVEAGYGVVVAHTAEEGLAIAQKQKPALYLLDVMVPHMGGWALCRHLRQFTDAPILFMTALGNSEHIVHGLQLGADDYITKPFNQAEFLARIQAHLRRHAGQPLTRFNFGEGALEIDLESRMVLVQGTAVELTPREFDLLAVLARHAGRVVRTPDLLAEAWGETFTDAKHNIKPYIHYLRKKIEEDPAAPRWVHTVRGIGYRLADT